MEGVVQVGWDRSQIGLRAQYLLAGIGIALWLVYTRLFWPLQAAHATLPACPFLTLTGHPCPLCGGTRSFAAMWQGDLAAAARYHPLGPALFLLSLIALVVAAAGAISGRRLTVRMPLRLEHRLYLGLGAAFAVSWLLKLVWLGN